MKNNGIIGTIAGGLTDSTRTIHEINKQNITAITADTKANFEEATKPNPDFVRFKQAKGLGNKIKVIAENIKAGAKANSEKETQRRGEIQSHISYQTLLEEQRTRRQAIIARS